MQLAPLTILFGANGAGKSTILEAIEEALIPSAIRKRKIVEGLGQPNIRSAVVYATLDDWKIPGSSDERIMRDVLWMSLHEIEDKDIGESELNFAFPDEAPPLQDLLLQRATMMIESGTIGTPEQRTVIATHLLENSILAFGEPQTVTGGRLEGDYGTHWGLVCRAPLDEKIRAARNQRSAAGRKQAADLAKQPIPPPPFDVLVVGATGPELSEIESLLPYYDLTSAQVRFLGPSSWAYASGLGLSAIAGGWYAAPAPQLLTGHSATFWTGSNERGRCRTKRRRPPSPWLRSGVTVVPNLIRTATSTSCFCTKTTW